MLTKKVNFKLKTTFFTLLNILSHKFLKILNIVMTFSFDKTVEQNN